MFRNENRFTEWDYVLFVAMLTVSIGIGVYHAFCGGKQKTTGEFLMGNRNMQLFPIAISIMASFISAILILGTPAEMYTEGTLYMVYIIGACIGCLLASLLFVPLMYPLKLTSSYEYLERRFNSSAPKLTATCICIVQQVLYIGIASYAPSTALEAVTGFPEWATIVIIGVVATLYTFLGGMKAVVWTDVFQALVMIAGILAIVIQGSVIVGGIDHVWRINADWGRVRFDEFSPDPTIRHTFWNLLVGASIGWMGTYGTSQASVQRYSSLPSLRNARLSIVLNIIGVSFLIFVTCLAGIVVFAYYATKGCDPLTSNQIDNTNQIIPFFVMEVLGYPGLPGLFIACLFSGALSSVSSSLNGLSAITWEGFLKRHCKNLSETKQTLIIKVLVAAFGSAGVGVAFMAKQLGGTVLQASLSFTGASGGPMTGLFILGSLFPWANWKGAVAGGTLGLVLPLWISIGAYSTGGPKFTLSFPTHNCPTNTTPMCITTPNLMTTMQTDLQETSGLTRLYSLSYLWFSSIGIAGCVIIGLVVSFITGPNKPSDVDPKYLIPLFDRLFCCLPSFIRRKFRCDLEFKDPEVLSQEEKDTTITIPPPSDDKEIPKTVAGRSKDSIHAMTDNSVSLSAIKYQNGDMTAVAYENKVFDTKIEERL